MKNITLKIDDETYRKARIRAANENTSVSAMVREFLAGQAAEDETHARRVAALKDLYRIADARAEKRSEPLIPLTREEIYRDRLR
jgi:plasmid stability protein